MSFCAYSNYHYPSKTDKRFEHKSNKYHNGCEESVVNCKESINNHQNLKFVVHSDFIESDDSFEARTDR